MDGSSTLSLIVAVVAALSSLVVAAVSHFSTRKNTHDLVSFIGNPALVSHLTCHAPRLV